MNFSARVKKILLIMLEENEPISVVKLSEKIGVSKRTVQRELEYLPKDLSAYNLKFASKTGVGVWILGEEEEKANLLKLLKSESYIDDTDKEYRRKKITLEILKDKNVKKLFWYSTKFKVSEATISSDLEALEKWFEKFDLKIIKKPGSGISVKGSEAAYRRAIKAFISENIDAKFLIDAYESDTENAKVIEEFQKYGFMKILGEDTVSRVMDCINGVNSSHVRSLTENSYIGLVMHISVAVKRILDNETIDNNSGFFEKIVRDSDYDVAEKIALEIKEEFEIEIPEIEISYIYLHIKASKYEKVQNASKMNFENIKTIADEMIYAFDEKNAYKLKQDEDFLHSLHAHLSPTIIRLTNGMKIHNPMLNEVKAQYAEVYEKCKNSALILESYVRKPVPAAEIGFLTVHFAAAIVKLEALNSPRKIVNIGIVCSSGIGVSRLMRSKLRKHFSSRVLLTAYGKNEINEEVVKKEDFIISSLPLNSKEIEVINVNPLISEKDIENIRKLIDKYEVQLEEKDDVSVMLDLETISLLASQMRTIANEMKIYKLDKDINFINAVEQVAKNVCKEGDDREVVVKDIIARENMSSQVFPEIGFALLHAKSTGVKTPSFNIFTNEERQSFTSSELKGVGIIFVMLIPVDDNEKINSEILGCISSSLVEDTKLIDAVLAGENNSAVKHISKTLKSFFAEYIIKKS